MGYIGVGLESAGSKIRGERIRQNVHTPSPQPVPPVGGLGYGGRYMSTLGDDTATVANVKALQFTINRYVGPAIPSPIGEDGKLGSGTVAAAQKVTKYITSVGGKLPTGVLSTGVTKGFLASHIGAFTLAFNGVANSSGFLHKAPPAPRPKEDVSMPLPGEEGGGLALPGGGLMEAKVAGIPLVLVVAAGAIYYITQVRGKGGSSKGGGKKKR